MTTLHGYHMALHVAHMIEKRIVISTQGSEVYTQGFEVCTQGFEVYSLGVDFF